MVKLHLDLEVVSRIPGAYRRTADQLMTTCGRNLGNLVFRHPLPNLIEDFSSYEQVGYPGLERALKDASISQVIISAANWLGTSDADEAHNRVRANLIQSIDAPVTCFGLGAQARVSENIELGPETRRLAKVLSSKAKLMAVRDQFTRDILRKIKIDNSCVLGCPSNFINPDPKLGFNVASKAESLSASDPDWAELRLALSEMSGGSAHTGAIIGWTVERLSDYGAYYVIQGPDLLDLIVGKAGKLPRFYSENSSMTDSILRRRIRGRSIFFSAVESWLDFCRSCDLSVGMRIHGAMTALQAGTPALLIGHDRRTTGLAETMGIPQIHAEAFGLNSSVRPAQLFKQIANDLATYDSTRGMLAERMSAYLHENGLKPSPLLISLQAGGDGRQQ